MSGTKNPATLVFWNDLANDDKLKTCSRSARGLWTTECLPKAAASVEPGVIQIGLYPCVWNDDLPTLLANSGGGTREEVLALLTELVNSGAASVDGNGRIYNRRMVREEGIRRVRSEAGKRGADATNAGRQKSGKHPGKADGKPPGKAGGKTEGHDLGSSRGNQREIRREGENGGRQNPGKASGDPAGKTAPSSLLHTSDSGDLTTTESVADEGRAGAANGAAAALVDEAFALWCPVAYDLRIPEIGFMNRDRREALAERLAECGGIEGWQLALTKIREAKFLIDDAKGRPKHWVNLRNLLKPETFTGLMEGRYAERHEVRTTGANGKIGAATRSAIGAAVFAGAGAQDADRDRRRSGPDAMGDAEVLDPAGDADRGPRRD
jgi:hypothetical protein